MIGLVLVTHGNLALEFISAMQHVVGKQEQVEAVCIGPEDDMEMRREEILKKAGEVNSGNGTIVLTDMFERLPIWQFPLWTEPRWRLLPELICRC